MSDYPYIQTFDTRSNYLNTYFIQAVSTIEDKPLPIEDPILAFGPLERINIFVGATNAGKSRFLRALAECKSYDFYTSDNIHRASSNLISSLSWLKQSKKSLTFRLNQTHFTLSTYLHLVPVWAHPIVQNMPGSFGGEVVFDAQFFKEMFPHFKSFLRSRKSSSPINVAHLAGNSNGNPRLPFAKAFFQEGYKRSQLTELMKNKDDVVFFDASNASDEWYEQFNLLWHSFDILNQTGIFREITPPSRIYIPTLRTAVSLREATGARINNDIFADTVRQNYQIDWEGIEIFTGLKMYEKLLQERGGPMAVINRLNDFEEFLGAAFYEGREVNLVALNEVFGYGAHIRVHEGNRERDLHDLGDGINSLVMLLYKLFMAEEHSWVFIEEPEINLHPGLQRLFLQTILKNESLKERNLRIFLTTHSNHLLRMTLSDGTVAAEDISIFAFQRREEEKEKFLIRPIHSEHHDALALLGVQNASVLLAQCGIWVEGVTDRKYLRTYLQAYQESDEFKKDPKLIRIREDTHYAFWEYAGSNIYHYIMNPIPTKGTKEAEKYDVGTKEILDDIQSSALCNRIFLIADRDKNRVRKHEVFEAISSEHSNFQYYVTQVIEIENLLSPNVIRATLKKLFSSSEVPKDVKFEQDDYRGIRLGIFLEEKYPKECPKNLPHESGTLRTYYKNKLTRTLFLDTILC
jgi:hypothetical protein